MFNFKSSILFLLAPAFLVSGVVSATETETATTTQTAVESSKQYISDSTITAKVKTDLLADKNIKSLSISVTTNDGVVTLSGIVNSELQKIKVLRIAHKTEGVKKIKDELVINKTGKQ